MGEILTVANPSFVHEKSVPEYQKFQDSQKSKVEVEVGCHGGVEVQGVIPDFEEVKDRKRLLVVF